MIDKKKLRWLLAGGEMVVMSDEDLMSEYESLVDSKDDKILETTSFDLEFPNEGNTPQEVCNAMKTVEEYIRLLEENGYIKVRMVNFGYTRALVEGSTIVPFNIYKQHRLRELNRGVHNPTPLYFAQNYIKECLGINLQHGGVRSVYIKLFLDGKIDERDLTLLIMSKNIDIDLTPYYLSSQPEGIEVIQNKTPDNFIFIN